MKVLLVHNFYQQAGGEDTSFSNTGQLLKEKDHQILTYTRQNDEINSYSLLQKMSLPRKTVWANDTYQDICRIIELERPDIIHVFNSFPLVSPSIYYASQRAGIPVVQDLPNYRLICPAATLYRDDRFCTDCIGKLPWRGVLHRCYRESRLQTAVIAAMLVSHRWRKTWLTQVDMFVTRSEFSRNQFLAAGMPEQKLTVLPNFLYSPPEQRVGHAEYACFLGRLSPEKGVETLLHAWQEINLQLYLVGDGESREFLQNSCRKMNLTQVDFMGWQPHSEMFLILKQAQFLVVPSEWYEPFGYVVIEAFACGVPVIVSNIGGLAELVTDGDTGLHYEVGNVMDLREKIRWAISHPDEMERMGINGRKQFEKHYTSDVNYKQLIEIYNTVLSKSDQVVPQSD